MTPCGRGSKKRAERDGRGPGPPRLQCARSADLQQRHALRKLRIGMFGTRCRRVPKLPASQHRSRRTGRQRCQAGMAAAALTKAERVSLPPKPPPAGRKHGGTCSGNKLAAAGRAAQFACTAHSARAKPSRLVRTATVCSPSSRLHDTSIHQHGKAANLPSRLVRTTTLCCGMPSTWAMYRWCLSGHCTGGQETQQAIGS